MLGNAVSPRRRKWPIDSVSQFNFLASAIEALHEQATELDPEAEF